MPRDKSQTTRPTTRCQLYSFPLLVTQKHSKLVVFLWKAIWFESSFYVSFHFWEYIPKKHPQEEHSGWEGDKLCEIVPRSAIYNGEKLETTQMFNNGKVSKKK